MSQIDYKDLEPDDGIVIAQNKLESIKGKLINSIKTVTERGTDINVLAERSKELSENSKLFDRTAKGVRKKYCCQKYRNVFLIFLCLIVLALLIILPYLYAIGML